MPDPRFNSMHFGVDLRRRIFREARARLFGARGWLTLAGEQVGGWINLDDPAGSAEPLLPGAPFLLVDRKGGQVYELRTGLNTLGRFPNNDIILDDRFVSRRHCAILVHARGGCELHDTASLNGTWVNGTRVNAPVRLSLGDRIHISKRELVLASEDDYGSDPADDPTFVDDPRPSPEV